MIAVTEAELRENIGRYLDAVARGEEVEVCRDGKPVALVSPIRRDRVPSWKRDRPLLRLRNGASASQIIIQERNEGF